MTRARRKYACPACGKPLYVVFDAEERKLAMVAITCPHPDCGGTIRAEMPPGYFAEPADS